jgi:2-C-methyl-D-erythritol 4-phosphate cytidylyltransferase
MKKFAMLMAGGAGNRMKNPVPKQFAELAGKPVLMHTFDIFRKYDPEMEFILVLPETETDQWNQLVAKHRFGIGYQLALGGETRFHSVKNGLKLIPDDGIVFIHDAVRPLVSVETITNCYQTALNKGNAIPVVAVAESIRKVKGNNNKAVDRSRYFLVQTPQTFKTDLIKKAYRHEYSPSFTDDASVLEAAGEKINLVDGNRENIKITFPEDLTQVELLLQKNRKII